MSKGFVALLALTIVVIVATTRPDVASQTSSLSPPTQPANDFHTKVLQDAEGNVHMLWLVPALNNSATSPGIWYSKYTTNGTDDVPPTQITNSTSVQSADLAVDSKGNAIIVWADNPLTRQLHSALYLLRFNSTLSQMTRVITDPSSLIMWPSLAADSNGTSLYLTWSEYDPVSAQANVKCGIFTSAGLTNTTVIASYGHANAFPPQASMIYDNASRHLQIAWGESGSDGGSASTVNYAKLGSNGTVLATLLVAKFPSILRDVSITPVRGYDGAFVSWQTNESNSSVYVSEVSANGELAYVKELNYTTGQSRYLVLSTDAEGSLYVVWYQPSIALPQEVTASASPTDVSYLRMNIEGDITQTGSGVFQTPIMGVAVLSNGMVYGVSPEGLVRVVTPSQQANSLVAEVAIGFMSCLSLAGFAGSLWVEEGRYRWASAFSKLIVRSSPERPPQNESLLKTLARRPGLKLGEISRLDSDHRVGLPSLLQMERSGLLASFRDGLSRRFYIKNAELGQTNALRTQILIWILGHPGIWEAQLAKDLGLSQQIVHYHLRKLRESKLITTTIDENGCRKLFRLADGKSHRQASDERA